MGYVKLQVGSGPSICFASTKKVIERFVTVISGLESLHLNPVDILLKARVCDFGFLSLRDGPPPVATWASWSIR